MRHVSIFIEGLRSRPRLMFWLATLAQAAIWWLLPSIFYSAPLGDLPMVLAVGHEFQLGTDLGPPLAFWLAEIVYMLLGITGVYLLAQACVVVTFWAVFQLGRRIVGEQHAAMAVLLMVGIMVMTVYSPDFGPAMLGMALSALLLLHFWRAIGENQRHYWFLLALDLGLLLLTTYAGLILFACMMIFLWTTDRGRAALMTIEPWFAAIVVAVLLFPHLIWLDTAGETTFSPLWERLRSQEAADANFWAWLRLIAIVFVAHIFLLILVAVAVGWWRKPSEMLPTFVRPPLDWFARRFVYFHAVAPFVIATLVAVIIGSQNAVGGIPPYVTLSGLAVVAAAGDVIVIHRQRILGLTWSCILLLPPVTVIVAIFVMPWLAIELQNEQPARTMGAFFADTYQRRTNKPLEIVTGDPRLASLVAFASPSRPSYYDFVDPARTPWVTADDIKKKGMLVVWPARDTRGAPPPDVAARFPDLVVDDVPRAFEHAIQGRLPLARVGSGMIRPAAQGSGSPK
jgi:hypothetical protein